MRVLNDLTIEQIVARGLAGLLLAALLGGGIAAAALLAGGRRDWRAVFDPAAHVSIPGLLMAVLFRQGWLRPLTPLPRGRAALGAGLAALLLPLLIIRGAGWLRPMLAGWGLGPWARFGLSMAQEVQQIAAGIWAFSLLPLPPLAGAYWLAAAAPAWSARFERRAGWIEAALVLALVAGWIPALGGHVLAWLASWGGMR